MLSGRWDRSELIIRLRAIFIIGARRRHSVGLVIREMKILPGVPKQGGWGYKSPQYFRFLPIFRSKTQFCGVKTPNVGHGSAPLDLAVVVTGYLIRVARRYYCIV